MDVVPVEVKPSQALHASAKKTRACRPALAPARSAALLAMQRNSTKKDLETLQAHAEENSRQPCEKTTGKELVSVLAHDTVQSNHSHQRSRKKSVINKLQTRSVHEP